VRAFRIAAAAARAAARIRPTGRRRPAKTSTAPIPPRDRECRNPPNPRRGARPPAGAREKRAKANQPTIQTTLIQAFRATST
jgi:hypothetical protein